VNGILILNKPTGPSSHAVIERVRRLIPGVKVGHTGTLDPAASGVLPVCLGKATRVASYLMDLPKGYRAGVELGIVTDTEDASGRVLAQSPVPPLDRAGIEKILQGLTGVREQIPPAYSAVKYRGKPLYYWTRRGVSTPARRPRKIAIYRLALLEYNPAGKPHLVCAVECSRGTYIRTLAAEIGERIGCGAYLFSLVRTFVGPFTLDHASSPGSLEEAAQRGALENLILPMDRALLHLPGLHVDDHTLLALKHGRPVPVAQLELQPEILTSGGQPLRIYDRLGNFKALAKIEHTGNECNLKTVKYLA